VGGARDTAGDAGKLDGPWTPDSTFDVYDKKKNPMANPDAVVEWMKGTGLRPYLDTAGAQHAEAFTEAYRARIAALYQPMADGRILFRFPRLFVVAVKA